MRRAVWIASVTSLAIWTIAAPSAASSTGQVVTLKMRSGRVISSCTQLLVEEWPTAQAGDRHVQVGGERLVAAQQAPLAIEHRDRIADRVEGRFPLLLAGPDERV